MVAHAMATAIAERKQNINYKTPHTLGTDYYLDQIVNIMYIRHGYNSTSIQVTNIEKD